MKKKKVDPEDVESDLVLEAHECTKCRTYFRYHVGQVTPYPLTGDTYVRCPVCASEQIL